MSDLTPNTSTVRAFSSEETAVTVPVFRPPVSPAAQSISSPNAERTPPPEPPVRIPHPRQAKPAARRRHAIRLVPSGIVLSRTTHAISSLVPLPRNVPVNAFFRTPSDVWLVAAFGTLLAPLFEEVVFRGFLLPAFA